MPNLRSCLTVGLIVFSATACGSQEPSRITPVPSLAPSVDPAATPSPAQVPALVTVETSGGDCPNGPCGSVLSIEADGRINQHRPTDLVVGQVPPEVLEAVRIEIDQANFELIRSRPFTETCPTAYDGQQTTYVFTVGMGTGFERIDSCEVVVDTSHPLFVAVDAALAAAASP